MYPENATHGDENLLAPVNLPVDMRGSFSIKAVLPTVAPHQNYESLGEVKDGMAAQAAFEENIKGSLSPGKFADFVVLDQNLITCNEEDILKTKVIATYVGGDKKFAADSN